MPIDDTNYWNWLGWNMRRAAPSYAAMGRYNHRLAVVARLKRLGNEPVIPDEARGVRPA